MKLSADESESFRFDSFTLIPGRRTLLEGSASVRLGGRAFDLLVELVRHAGQVVSKSQLIAAAWPRAVVDEASLRVHISALRKLLGGSESGTHYILNMPGQGYSFVASVAPGVEQPSPHAAGAAQGLLPHRQARLIGRESVMHALHEDLAEHRFVNIVGPGGIGKSTVALATAESLLPELADGARFVDLAVVHAASMVASAVAAALGLVLDRGVSLGSVLRHARHRHLLLILDNCEHVAEGVAELIPVLLHEAPMIRVLSTSREVLQAEGERVHRLQGLVVPPSGAAGSAGAALRYSAIQLFVERATACRDEFRFTDPDGELVAELCRRLDGLPLAIELAAAQLGPGGVQELLERLVDPLQLLSQDSNIAGGRHRALHEVLASSHGMLSTAAQRVLRRLSVFAGDFTLQAAVSVATSADLDEDAVVGGAMELATKSLLSPRLYGDTARYRLLETTRAFAREKLDAAAEDEELHLRHAKHVMHALDDAAADWPQLPQDEWEARHGQLIDDVRLALDWATDAGQWQLAARLTAAAFPFGHQLSLLDEFRARVELVLPHLPELEPPMPQLELKLLALLIALLGQTKGITPAMVSARRRAAELSARQPVQPSGVETWRAMWAGSFGVADYAQAMRYVEDLDRLATALRDAPLNMVVERMRAQTLHFMGQHDAASALAEKVLERLGPADRPSGRSVHPIDPRVSLRILLARSHWLRGDFSNARSLADEAVERAASGVGYSLCQALGLAACPMAIWAGDLERAALLSRRLSSYAAEHALYQWQLWGENFMAVLEGKPVSIHPADHKQRDLFMTLTADAFDPDSLRDVRERSAGWCEPEVLRLAAQTQAGGPVAAAAEARALVQEAMELAGRQGAVAWELRAALSWCQSRAANAQAPRAVLRRICDRIGPGASTPDIELARSILMTC